MPTTAQRVLKAYLWLVAVVHLFIGLALNFSESFTRMIAANIGATVDWTPQFTQVLHPLGAFVIALGFLAAVAARAPERYDAVIFAFIGLFAIRALQLLVFASGITAAFAIAPSRNTMNALMMAVQAVLLFVLWRAARQRQPT